MLWYVGFSSSNKSIYRYKIKQKVVSANLVLEEYSIWEKYINKID